MLSSDSSHYANDYLTQDPRAFWMLRHLLHLPPILKGTARWTVPSQLALLLDLTRIPTKILVPYIDIADELGDYADVVRDCTRTGYTVTLIGPDVLSLVERVQNPMKQWTQPQGFKKLHIWSLVRRAGALIEKSKGTELMMRYDTVLHDKDGNVLERPQHADKPCYHSRHSVARGRLVIHEYYLTWDTWLTSSTSVGAYVSAAICPPDATRFFSHRHDLSRSSAGTPSPWFIDMNAEDRSARTMDVVTWPMNPGRYQVVPAITNATGTALLNPADHHVAVEPWQGQDCFIMPLQFTPTNAVHCPSLHQKIRISAIG